MYREAKDQGDLRSHAIGQDAGAGAAAPARDGELQALAGDERGTVAIIFALAIAVLFGAVGGAIDFAQVYRARAMVQNGLDAATLAAGRVLQTGGETSAALNAAEAHMRPIRSQLPVSGPISFGVADGGASFVGSADLRFATPLLSIIGFDSMPIVLASKAKFGAGAEDLINIVVWENQSRATAKVAIAPFSNVVGLDSQLFNAATGRSSGGPSVRCVVERTGSEMTTETAPRAGAYLRALEDAVPGRACPENGEVVPLTADKSRLTAMVRRLGAAGSTAGHLGSAWAWYLLSPLWSGALHGESQPGSYADLTNITAGGFPRLRKIAVLMTDGEYNTQYSATSSTNQAREVCRNMKATGIEVFTVGFDVGSAGTAVDTLRQCATSPSHFYNTTTGSELRRAFRDIALQASPLRLSN
jgi:hypothetical protein